MKNQTKIILVLIIVGGIFAAMFGNLFSVAGLNTVYFQSATVKDPSTEPYILATDADFTSLNQGAYGQFPSTFKVPYSYEFSRETWFSIFRKAGVTFEPRYTGTWDVALKASTISQSELETINSILEDVLTSPKYNGEIKFDADGRGADTVPVYWFTISGQSHSPFDKVETGCRVQGFLYEEETDTTQSFDVTGKWRETDSYMDCVITENIEPDTVRPWDNIEAEGYYYTFKDITPVNEEPPEDIQDNPSVELSIWDKIINWIRSIFYK